MYCIPSASRRGVWTGYEGWEGVEGGVTGCKVKLVLGLDVPSKHRAGTGHVHLPGGPRSHYPTENQQADS